jgi:hypothetical protein
MAALRMDVGGIEKERGGGVKLNPSIDRVTDTERGAMA